MIAINPSCRMKTRNVCYRWAQINSNVLNTAGLDGAVLEYIWFLIILCQSSVFLQQSEAFYYFYLFQSKFSFLNDRSWSIAGCCLWSPTWGCKAASNHLRLEWSTQSKTNYNVCFKAILWTKFFKSINWKQHSGAVGGATACWISHHISDAISIYKPFSSL